MQLFVTQPEINNHIITLTEERVIKYIGRVLRMKHGDQCMIQREEAGESTKRTITILEITKKQIIGQIIDTQTHTQTMPHVSLLIALPNKFSKLELMVQKCTEIGIDALYFRRSEKSILKTISDKRMKRLRTIAFESVEQCKRRHLPHLELVKTPETYLEGKEVIVFDFVEGEVLKDDIHVRKEQIVGVVGPEGHFGEKDYALLKEFGYTPIGLGDTVLRTETAAIVGAWYLCNIWK